jgi:hypothetical protein
MRPSDGRRRLAALAPAVLGGVLLVGLAFAAAGCGGGSGSPAVANLATTTTTAGAATTGGAGSGPATSQQGGFGGGGARLAIAGGSRARMTGFAACMRSHGEPGFPDPNAQGVISISSGAGLDPGSPQFEKARQACQKLLPGGGRLPSPALQAQERARALAFSACMRSHGVPKFPDPRFLSGGKVAISIGASSGIDPQSPQFQAAQKACFSQFPGGPKGPPAGGATVGAK